MSDLKVQIELSPFHAASILSFMREFVNDKNRHVKELTAIHETVDALEEEIERKFTYEMLEDMKAENEVNFLMQKQPMNKGGKPIG